MAGTLDRQSRVTIHSRLASGTASDRIEMLRRLIIRIDVRAESLEIMVRNGAVGNEPAVASDDEATTSIVVPVQLKR
jgi:hypothetical protein